MSKLRNTAIELVKDAVWYYENGGSIDLVIWPDKINEANRSGCNSGTCGERPLIQLRIPTRKLRETIKRQDAERKRRTKP